MNKELIKKICLGTAQFGMDYGVANKKGKISPEETFRILDFAHQTGIITLDTSPAYGESEHLIGKFMSKTGKPFQAVSKTHLASEDKNDINLIERSARKTLESLGQKKLYGMLLHKFEDIISTDNKIWHAFELLKEKHLTEKIGCSVYRPEELEYMLMHKLNFDIIQIPYSVFDRRFEPYMEGLKKKNVEIHARSVFLQGLVFLKAHGAADLVPEIGQYVEIAWNLAEEYGIPVSALCLNFVLSNANVDKAVIGVDSLSHLEKNIEDIDTIDKLQDIKDKLAKLTVLDEEILLPYKWDI